MERFSVLIADDERLAREAVKLELYQFPNASIVSECKNGREAFNNIIEIRPDIIFLDIQMPYLNGLEVLDQLPGTYSPSIIIVSAFDNYALKAFENDAIDYLVKPFTSERFARAFTKAIKLSSAASTKEFAGAGAIQELKRLLSATLAPALSTISIKDGLKIYVVNFDDIVYFEASGNYVSVVTKEKKYLHRDTLQSLEGSLPEVFARIHKSVIVNSFFISQFDSLLNGDYTVSLKTGHQLRLSRNFKSKLQHLMS